MLADYFGDERPESGCLGGEEDAKDGGDVPPAQAFTIEKRSKKCNLQVSGGHHCGHDEHDEEGEVAETGDDGIVQAEPVCQPRHDHEDGKGLLRVNVFVRTYSTQASWSTMAR